MLDPLTALSVVSSVIQIVDYGCKLVSRTQEIYHSASGATKENVTKAEITKDIQNLYKDLTIKDNGFQRLNTDDIVLGKLIDKCNEAARELLQLLAELQVPLGPTKWASFHKALKSGRQKGRVEGIETRLLKIQKQIDSHLQVMMKYVT